MVLASLFESLIYPFIIIFTVPFALIGVVIALFITNTSISVTSYIGLIMLVGIVVNSAIILVDFINHLRKEEKLSRKEAIKKAILYRFRPIMMTTLTTILGLLPMALISSNSSTLRAPMAITVIGGLISATFLTLIIIPVIYEIIDNFSYKFKDKR
jgi:HAE1 family hydrophobic/amphiphilic exporter-1